MGNRIYYAVQQAGIGGTTIHGLQSVGISSNFTMSNIQELGQISIYDTKEDNCEVQVSLKKVLDGNPLIYVSAVGNGTLAVCSSQRCTFNLSVFDDNTCSWAVGTPMSQLTCTGLYVSSAKYTFNTEGNFEEEVTLVGNHKTWAGGSFNGTSTNTDIPASAFGVSRRQDILLSSCALPTGMPANSHISSISTSVSLNRESLYKLGKKYPYFRPAVFPAETSTEITINATSGDGISMSEVESSCARNDNTCKETITIVACEGTSIALGSGNRLASVNYSGGDAGGGIVKVSYTYKGYNDFTVTH
jgi:hypothetical protein